MKSERDKQIKKDYIKLRESNKAGICYDILADKYKMQFDNIKRIVYKKDSHKLKLKQLCKKNLKQ
jgi:hypothetical protein